MRAKLVFLKHGEAPGRDCPGVLLRCFYCGEDRPVYVYDGEIPPMIAPALRALVERFQPEQLPGTYLCGECHAEGLPARPANGGSP